LNPHGISTTSPSNSRVCHSTTRAIGRTILRVVPVIDAGTKYYLLTGAGAAGFDAGAAGAAGSDEAGAAGPPNGSVGAVEWIEAGLLRPSKILPLIRLVEEYARNKEVNANSAAKTHVSLNIGVLAPPEPKTVWLEPPNTAPTSAPLPCCNNTTIVSAMQTIM
jgi:hypothetical protein